MKTRLIHYSVGTLLCGLPAARAGSRAGGSGASAVTIPADTLDQGGAAASAGTGATAVRIQASVGGMIGTATAAAPAVNNRQGYIPQVLSSVVVSGYELWAAINIPAGQNAAFNGDANNDAILNGVAYVFGTTRLEMYSNKVIPAPPPIPPDVNVYLDRSPTLAAGDWTTVGSWVNWAAPVFANGVIFDAGDRIIFDTFAGPKAYYRYRAVKR